MITRERSLRSERTVVVLVLLEYIASQLRGSVTCSLRHPRRSDVSSRCY